MELAPGTAGAADRDVHPDRPAGRLHGDAGLPGRRGARAAARRPSATPPTDRRAPSGSPGSSAAPRSRAAATRRPDPVRRRPLRRRRVDDRARARRPTSRSSATRPSPPGASPAPGRPDVPSPAVATGRPPATSCGCRSCCSSSSCSASSGRSTTATPSSAAGGPSRRGSAGRRAGAPEWASRFDAPLALLLLVPALLLTFAPPPRPRGGGSGRAGGGSRSLVRTLLLTALVFALAGFRLVLPVDRLATVFVVDLSDSVGEAGREDALAFVRDSLKAMPEGDVAGIVGVRQGRARRAAAGGAPRDRPDRLGAGRRPRPTSAARCGSRRRCSRTTPRSGSCCSPTATTRPAAARPRRRSRRRAGSRSRRGRSGSGRPTRSSSSGSPTPSTARLGEEIEVGADIRSTVAQPATVRLFADGVQVAERAPSTSRPARHRSRSGSSRPRPGFHTFRVVVEAAPEHVQPERPGRLEHDRQGRAADPRRWPATRRSPRSSSGRSRPSASRSTRCPGGSSPTELDGLADVRQHRPRRRPADSPHGPPAAGAPGRTSATSARAS